MPNTTTKFLHSSLVANPQSSILNPQSFGPQSTPLSRRDFLAAGVGCAALGAVMDSEAAPIETPAIDTHTHFYDPTRPQGVPWPNKSETLLYRTYLPKEFRALTRKHGVVGTVVVEASPWVEDNQWILDLAKENDNIVGFVGNLQLGQPEFAAHLRRFSANQLFRGLRIGEQSLASGLGQKTFEDDVRRLVDQGLTLDLLGGKQMLPNAARLAKLAPKLRIIIDHLPFEPWDQDLSAARSGLSEIAAWPNIYAKVSNVARQVGGRVVEDAQVYRSRLDLLWELFGIDRLIYGSNWPVSERVAPYSVVHQIVARYFTAKGKAAAEKFFWRNSLKFYGWQKRGEAANQLK